ncbi:GntR family transcriptional regulator [Lederbergia galactosidilytica]|uniref:GntR family transcriptional regulator n=1 Tax=Lederbergia galactosidilytica TaxID=217031 RepID=A0A0Q9Y7S8_9BACI|nr:GntR family transcriptional regulator [Lederbergia galactosidilytica]KRG14920.1 GntR family transcriptional regulator [Virgibacillus soli]KRG16902.1 GntR family transcriptional regulator [Lederbergia galactosidilytica]MBP1917327.1 DNA-binding transcriptional regulator YhcF (GntR family) [Lederbergia galactosidilytica]OAK73836.1 GntR family transcriptional regulator [Lederbergia galactosidilytica]
MLLYHDGAKPIYVQIAEWIENEIIAETFKRDEKVFSQYQLAEMFTINPATAAKGLNMLVNEQVLYKKRGLGMFVAKDARKAILNKRKNETLTRLVQELVSEAKRLEVSEIDLLEMIQDAINGKGEE